MTAREAELLTGVSTERLRTWERRHGLSVYAQGDDGRRQVKLAEIPTIIAVNQLIAAGYPVGVAIERVKRDGIPAPDVAALTAMFGGVSQPVVAFTGPLPMQPIWANAAARGGADGELRPLEPCEPAYRALQRLLIKPNGGSIQFSHDAWCGDDARHDALAWSLGHAGGEMPVAVVVGLPSREPDAPEPDPLLELPTPTGPELRDVVAGLRGARVALQRSAGLPALGAALNAISCGVGAQDAFLVLGHEPPARICKSVRGRLYRAQLERFDPSWDQAGGQEAGGWLSDRACEDVGAVAGAHLLALPLAGEQAKLGFAVLDFADRPHLTDATAVLLAAFAAAASASLHRDRVVAARRKILTSQGTL